MNSLTELTPKQLRRAADLQERILSLQDELGSILGAAAPVVEAKPKRTRRMSRAGRAAIAAAARARWAKLRAGKPAKVKAVKRKMSPAGRARLAALARARWAKVKASGKSRL
jgi:hypothetical protein